MDVHSSIVAHIQIYWSQSVCVQVLLLTWPHLVMHKNYYNWEKNLKHAYVISGSIFTQQRIILGSPTKVEWRASLSKGPKNLHNNHRASFCHRQTSNISSHLVIGVLGDFLETEFINNQINIICDMFFFFSFSCYATVSTYKCWGCWKGKANALSVYEMCTV